MSLRRDTLLRAHSLPGHQKSSKSKKKETEVENEGVQIRRRSFFSVPMFPPLRKSSSNKSRSLEASPDPPAWKRKEFARGTTTSPRKLVPPCSPRKLVPPCSCSPKKQQTLSFESYKEPYSSHVTKSCDKEIMVSGDRCVSKSIISERKLVHGTKKLSSLTHDDLMQHVKNRICEEQDNDENRIDENQDLDVVSDNDEGLVSMENSPDLSSRLGTKKPAKLSRDLTLPIKSQHNFDDDGSPSVPRRCCSLDNTPNKALPRCYSDGQRTPRKFKVYRGKFECLTQQDYVQLLYGNLPRDVSSRDHNNNDDDDILFVPLNSILHSNDTTPIASTETTPIESPVDSPSTPIKRYKLFGFYSPKIGKSPLTSPKKSPSKSPRKNKYFNEQDKESLTGFLFVNLHYGKGFSKNSDTYVILEMDSYGHFFKKAKTKPCRGSDPQWEESFEFEIEACSTLRLTCFNKLRLMGNDVSGKCSINLTRENLIDNRNHTLSVSLDRGQSILNVSLCFSTSIDGIKKCPSFSEHGVFGVPIMVVCKREKFDIPVIVLSCIKEIEKRGMDEVGIYRLSGVASEIQQLKKLFNEHTQNALLVLADTDIHAVAGLLKLYFRELPQSLFTSKLYRKFVDGLSITDSEEKELYMVDILHQLPTPNKVTALYLFEHLRRVTLLENENKMGVNNLATVFGPTVLRPPSSASDKENESKSCYVGTFDIGALDVMSQVGIFRYFLGLKNNERTQLPKDNLELWRRLDPGKAKKMEEELMITSEEHLI